jgi:hypothetical protein
VFAQICPRDGLGHAGIGGRTLKIQILSLLALQPAVTMIEYAWDATTRLTAGQGERFRAQGRVIGNRPIRIISFHPSNFASFQDHADWHDMSGHHLYYGRSA